MEISLSLPFASRTPVPILDESRIGEARRLGVAMAKALNLSEDGVGRVAIIVTEVASNIYKHAKQDGQVFLRGLSEGDERGLEILAIDRGPGIQSMAESMRDGFSSTRTQGIGLGGMRRLASTFDIYSQPDQGTVVVARVWSDGPLPAVVGGHFEIGVVSAAAPGETLCGDAWAVETDAAGLANVMVVDGLGHGEFAHRASQEAVRVFRRDFRLPLPELMRQLHAALKPTRGAAVGLVRLDYSKQKAHFVGVGNISVGLCSPMNSQRMASMNGIVGYEFRAPKEFTYPLAMDSVVVACSDGLTSKWTVEPYPGLLKRDPAVLAGVLYRDFVRGQDDATVLACRFKRGVTQ